MIVFTYLLRYIVFYMKLMSSIRTIFARSVRPSEQLIRIALWLLIIYLSYLLTGWYVTRDDTYLQLPDVTSPIARLFPTATPTSTPTMTPYPTYPPPTPTPTPSLINPTVLHDDLYLSYIHHDHTAKTSTFTEIDFLTNTKVDHELPYLNSNSSVDGLRYLISPDGIHFFRTSWNVIEIANLSEGSVAQFKLVYKLPDSLYSGPSSPTLTGFHFDSNANLLFFKILFPFESSCPSECYTEIHTVNPSGIERTIHTHKYDGDIISFDEVHRNMYLIDRCNFAEVQFINTTVEQAASCNRLVRRHMDSSTRVELKNISVGHSTPVFDSQYRYAYVTSNTIDESKLRYDEKILYDSQLFQYDLRSYTKRLLFSLDQTSSASGTLHADLNSHIISPHVVQDNKIIFSLLDRQYPHSKTGIVYALDIESQQLERLPIDCMGTTVTPNGYTLCEDNAIENIHAGTKIQLSKTPLDIVAFESGRRLVGGNP